MSWDSSPQDAWNTSAMSNSLPLQTATDGEDWGNPDDFVVDTSAGDQGFGDSGDFSFGVLETEPIQEDGCRRCKKPGHFAKNCPEPQVCFNCGEPGHNKADCVNPKKFRGTCRHCGVEGHHGSDCPDRPKMACFNCGEEGHSKVDCPNPKVFKGPCRHCSVEGHQAFECPDKPEMTCYNCNETGHGSKECPHPRVFKGTCRVCSQEGHTASECPDRPPLICRSCEQEGHAAAACTEPRKIHQAREGAPITPADESWAKMVEADMNGELEDFKEHLMEYSRALPEVTLRDLEEAFRSPDQNFRVHLIAMETQTFGNKTIVNLQGKPDQKYVVKFQFGAKPKRSGLVGALIATSAEENLERLEEAGFIMDGVKPYCSRCKQTGHIVKTCPEEKPEHVGEKRDENSVRERPVPASASLWATTSTY